MFKIFVVLWHHPSENVAQIYVYNVNKTTAEFTENKKLQSLWKFRLLIFKQMFDMVRTQGDDAKPASVR